VSAPAPVAPARGNVLGGAKRIWAGLPVETRRVSSAAAVVTVLDWPAWARPKPGLDQSWEAGIAYGFVHHMQWGPALDFTYGPYGFAAVLEPFYRSTALIAFIYGFAVTWTLAALLVLALRSRWGLMAAGAGAWAAIGLAQTAERVADSATLAGLGLALVLLRARPSGLRTFAVMADAALSCLAFLVKLNAGIVMAALLLIAIAGSEGSRRERLSTFGQALLVGAAVFVTCWVAARQSFANLGSFASRSVTLVLGYSTAMAGRLVPKGIEWWAVPIGVAVGLGLYAGLRGWPRRQQTAGAALVTLWGWASVKEGFVSGNHWPLFFSFMLCASLVVGLTSLPKLAHAAVMLLTLLIFLEASSLPSSWSPLQSVKSFFAEITDIVVPGDFARLVSIARADVVTREPLRGDVLSAIAGHTLAIEPWEDMVVWADPAVTWDPEPVVQSYSAYTTSLDRLDAAFLSSWRAPQRVLVRRFPKGFDTRDFFMDPPATTEALFCHYTQELVDRRFQVLQRSAGRCGRAVEVEAVQSHFGEQVRAPAVPGKMVVARFYFSLPVLSKVKDFFLRPPFTYLTVWGDRGTATTYRFVTGTAADDHVLNVPASLGYAPLFTPPPIRALEFSGAGWARGSGALRVVFYAVPLS
jgi:hypothetical protein